MLINLRNALMSGKRLPYDAEVEFLQTDGTNYIATGIRPPTGATVKTELTFGFASSSSSVRRFLFSDGNQNVTHYCEVNASSQYGAGTAYISQTLSADTMYNATATFTSASASYSIDINGTQYTSSTTSYPSSAWRELILFRISSEFRGAGQRIGACKIYVNGVLVRDFIPVRKGAVGYMYDRVSGKLFGNAGTGDFQYGPDVVPVEWLEGGQVNGGIAFIDTGYAPNSSTKVESTSAILSTQGYSGRFGDRSRFTFGVGAGVLYLAQGNHYYLGGYTAGTFYSFVNDIANRTVSVEGVGSTSTAAVSNWYPQLYPIYLFASNVSPTPGTVVDGKQLDTNSLGRIRMKSCSIWENNIPAHKLLPIRVGTEGAMMDVLTRRIYRNAGTGAFTYGNDLKYPIPAS